MLSKTLSTALSFLLLPILANTLQPPIFPFFLIDYPLTELPSSSIQ